MIAKFAQAIVHKHGLSTQQALLLPSQATAARCMEFLKQQVPSLEEGIDLRAISLYPRQNGIGHVNSKSKASTRAIVVAVLFPHDHLKVAKIFWQHTGEGISSRRAEVCHKAFDDAQLVLSPTPFLESPTDNLQFCKGPQRYRKQSTTDMPAAGTDPKIPQLDIRGPDTKDYSQFVEERFGRNLDSKLAAGAKAAIKKRIAGAFNVDIDHRNLPDTGAIEKGGRGIQGISLDEVYLYPTGMSSIFNTHRNMLRCRGSLKSICFGSVDMFTVTETGCSADRFRFPYIDTLKILEKWGPGCIFYGHGSSEDIDDIERRCEAGEKFLALFCEFPGNPLLKTPDLARLRSLADRFDFAVVIDETIGNFLNVHVLPYADIVVSSLTKVFSGDSNVMGGRLVTLRILQCL